MLELEKIDDTKWGVVLGGSDGLGEAYAEALAARGMNLILVGRRAARLAEFL
jgi:short-subunit dehydrogenase